MNKTLYIILIFTIFLIQTIIADDNMSSTKRSKWTTLNSLIKTEEKTIRDFGQLGPKLKYRLLELESEKIRLSIEKENNLFISKRYKDRKHKKSWYFRKSKRLFKNVNKMGLQIIKEHPNFNEIAKIYYTLALNERDYGADKRTEEYLYLALTRSNKEESIIHNVKISLAEYYYNNKNYNLAVKYYEQVVKNKKDNWHTKHLFNYAWCLLKEEKTELAIKNMKDSFVKSTDPKYISMKEQIHKSLLVFFVHGNKIKDGINFYIKNVNQPTDHLISMAKKTAKKGLFKQTIAVIEAAVEQAKKNKTKKKLVSIRLAELDIYRSFKKDQLYFKTAKDLKDLHLKAPLSAIDQDEAVKKISSLVGYLQIRLSNNHKISNNDYQESKLRKVICYFKILAALNQLNKDLYFYYIGETYYSVSRYSDAAKFYKQAILASLERKNIEIARGQQRKIFNSLLSLLGSTDFDKKADHSYTLFTYEKHLLLWPKNKTSKVIYERLFNLYIKKKDISNSIRIVEMYIKYYQNKKSSQQAMITKIMDFHINNNNTADLSIWITKIQNGFLQFNKSYIEKSMAILGTLLFQQYQKLENNGQKELAADGYKKIFFDQKYPLKIKAQSAFNAALIYLDLADTDKAYKWIKYSIIEYKVKNKKALLPKLKVITEQLALLQDFKRAALLSTFIMIDFCEESYQEKNSFYKMSVHYQLLENNFDTAYLNFKLGKRCKIKNHNIISNGRSIIQFLTAQRKYKEFFRFYNKSKNSRTGQLLQRDFVSSMLEIYWETIFSRRLKLERRIKKTLSKLTGLKKLMSWQMVMINEIKVYDSFSKLITSTHFKLLGNQSVFNQKEFNRSLNNNLLLLRSITIQGEKLVLKGHKLLIIATYINLQNKYQQLVREIKNFSPRGVSKEFTIGFKASMKKLSSRLELKSNSHKINALSIIENNEILSYQNFNFIKDKDFIKEIDYRYLASKLVSTADTEGKLR